MRSSFHGFTIVAAATLLFAGCADSRQSETTGPATLATTQATCQFTIIPDLMRMYLAPADQAIARPLIIQMENFFNNGDLARATDKGFDILALIEAATNAGRQAGSPAAGSNFANAILACMSVGQPALPIDFSGALGAGAFAVRGGPTDPTGPVISRDNFSGVGLQESTWQAVFGKRILIFGIPNPNTIFNELLVGAPHTWSTLPPSPVINPGAVIGFCVTNPGRYRVEESHQTTPHSILFLRDASSFLTCPAPIAPAALGPVGGSAGGFSDFAPVDPVAINLAYLVQPSNVQAGQVIAPAVRIQSTGNGGTPLPEVAFVLSLVRISGNGNLSGSLRKLTGPTGIETFNNLRVSQPGTYALLVTASAVGFGTVTLQSNQFTVTP